MFSATDTDTDNRARVQRIIEAPGHCSCGELVVRIALVASPNDSVQAQDAATLRESYHSEEYTLLPTNFRQPCLHSIL